MSPSLLRWQLVLWTAINDRLFFFHQGFMSGPGRSSCAARDQQGGRRKKKKKSLWGWKPHRDHVALGRFTTWCYNLLHSMWSNGGRRCKTKQMQNIPKIRLFSFPAQNTSPSDDWHKENNLFLSLNISKAVIVQFSAKNSNEFGKNRKRKNCHIYTCIWK